MVRVFLKGGVWKNSEDEILKAAVMKYGKQQWARVASLLNRKSAKQCKARWHEWLDPEVRKVSWSRAEEEKLLHLAKLMPAQWKTIGPLVGRTAAQCQEHYLQLLDEAAGGASATAEGESGQQLRPGQIDSHPETKPARPDPIDMDEDEIEMLQEARARLANTQGKKAKRKAREKMLQEAKRLADLQKRRELKQAGLLSSAAAQKARRRNRDIDLGVEIPFHKPAPAGFHDVSSENSQAEAIRKKRLKEVDYKRINENQYRTRDREASQAQKREEARLRSLERSNMQYAVAQVSKTNDPLATRKRGVLELPEPSVSEAELNQLAKLTSKQDLPVIDGEGNTVTQALLGDYSNRPLPTPMRTPMTHGSNLTMQESILRQASNLRMLEQGQTPLLGGDDPQLDESDMAAAATPLVPAMPGSATPIMYRNSTPMSVAPPRDELGLNKRPHSELRGSDEVSVSASSFATSTMSIRELAREERRAAKRARQDLEAALAALPAPQFEYELAAPQDMDEEDHKVAVETVDDDAADLEAAERARLQMEADRLYEARSSVVKRAELIRPKGAIPDVDLTAESLAERLIKGEMLTLLRHDAHAFPVAVAENEPDAKKKKKRNKMDTSIPPATPLDYLSEEALDLAKELLQVELEVVFKEKILNAMSEGDFSSEEVAEAALAKANEMASIDAVSNVVYTEKDGWVVADEEKRLESAKLELETLQEATAALRKRDDKMEGKLTVKNGGYSKRADTIRDATLQTFAEQQNAKIENLIFAHLQTHEVQGSANRIEKLKEEIAQLEEAERVAQKCYGDLMLDKRRLLVKLKAKTN